VSFITRPYACADALIQWGVWQIVDVSCVYHPLVRSMKHVQRKAIVNAFLQRRIAEALAIVMFSDDISVLQHLKKQFPTLAPEATLLIFESFSPRCVLGCLCAAFKPTHIFYISFCSGKTAVRPEAHRDEVEAAFFAGKLDSIDNAMLKNYL